MQSFRFLDDIATADAAFEARGSTAGEMFMASAEAVLAVMCDNPGDISPIRRIETAIEETSAEMLLMRYLEDIIYHKDAGSLLLRPVSVTMTDGGDAWRCEAVFEGERIDSGRHRMLVDVKAVTLHRFRVEETAEGWRATVVLDI